MFEISELKEKKLPELQEIAAAMKIAKYKTTKKLDLVYKILDHQAANPKEFKKVAQQEGLVTEAQKSTTAPENKPAQRGPARNPKKQATKTDDKTGTEKGSPKEGP
ncbi:MAG: Rho termination factor N-terminal domain-containing protein, partial [Marinirhabdus sp.]